MIIVTLTVFIGLRCVPHYRCVKIAVALSDTNKLDEQATDFPGNPAIAEPTGGDRRMW